MEPGQQSRNSRLSISRFQTQATILVGGALRRQFLCPCNSKLQPFPRFGVYEGVTDGTTPQL